MTAVLACACILALASSAVVFTLVLMLSTMSAVEADGDVLASSLLPATRDDDGTATPADPVGLLEPFIRPSLVDKLDLLGRGRRTRPLSLVLMLERLSWRRVKLRSDHAAEGHVGGPGTAECPGYLQNDKAVSQSSVNNQQHARKPVERARQTTKPQ